MSDRPGRSCDVLIVGTGPCGSAVARRVLELSPRARVTMVDAGPALSDVPGESVRNLAPELRRDAYRMAGTTDVEPPPDGSGGVQARPGTHLLTPVRPGADQQAGMPAAALSTNVGGMGAHWTCFSPRPGASEVIPFLDYRELDEALADAEQILRVTTRAFPPTPDGPSVDAALREAFPTSDGARGPQSMPLACSPGPDGRPIWTGAATVLGAARDRVILLERTLCRGLNVDSRGRVESAELENLNTGQREQLRATVVVVAADALRTPQLLWASDIRPWALGRFLNDQPQLIAAAAVRRHGSQTPSKSFATDSRDAMTGVHWVPFTADRPFHGIVLELAAGLIGAAALPLTGEGRLPVGMGWFTAKDLRAEDRVRFDDSLLDVTGMPRPVIDYGLSERDRQSVADAAAEMVRATEVLGELLPGGEPRLLPAGSSLHYQGSVRMGAQDDGGSVCDAEGRVWGAANLFVAGNGVIPTATACNPTLTSVALALRSGTAVGRELADTAV